MPDPITHATSPWIVAFLTSATGFLFDLPLGVVITATGGAYWAVYHNKSLEVSKSIFLIIAATAIASIMVHGVVWIFTEWLDINNVPQRPIAFFLGFAVIDKRCRDAIIEFIKSRLSFLEVQK